MRRRSAPPKILKKIRGLEIKTRALVEKPPFAAITIAFSRVRGMNFEEVREYQPGDEIRAIRLERNRKTR
jgi:hypothetical protein